MNPKIQKHCDQVLNHLYISPLEKCNLRCKMCYTRKSNQILKENEILEFVEKYKKAHRLETITFCGGEVFLLPYFTGLVNKLSKQGIFVQIITNGTIDKLNELSQPNLINLIVSLDGLPQYHDKNRGLGNFTKSLAFLKKARDLGFHTEIFSIVTRQNYPQIDCFEEYMKKQLGYKINITYHPRKPITYLVSHPKDNLFGEEKGFDFLKTREMVQLLKSRKTFPPKNLGCYQIALMSNDKVYGCCEGTVPIGNINDKMETLIKCLEERLENCMGCSQPDFVCGMPQYQSRFDRDGTGF
ncbi:radical SAM protein [Candidatus Microgenomates bacterium]|nr:radical SAM protein [Candidatus Microgenomates bacterium]